MLSALEKGDKKCTVTEIQKYAHDVFSRVSEIDNAFKNLNIAIEYLTILRTVLSIENYQH